MISPSDSKENTKGRLRLQALINQLTLEELKVSLSDGWTVSGILAHLAFWDYRVLYLIEEWKEFGIAPSPIDINCVNEAMKPICNSVAPLAAVDLVLHAAEAIDIQLEHLPEELKPGIDGLVREGKIRLNRAIHRNEHIDQIESELAVISNRSTN